MAAIHDAFEKLELVDKVPNDRDGRQLILPLAIELYRIASGVELDFNYRRDDIVELYYKGENTAAAIFSVAADSPAAALRDFFSATRSL